MRGRLRTSDIDDWVRLVDRELDIGPGMDTTRLSRHASITLCLALAAGLAFALWLLPPAMLDPLQWRWLLDGDRAQHFLGWHFFRNEGWQWPPGRLTAYGEAMGSSIVFTDSVPLLALLLKPFSPWLPAHLQYSGPWLLVGYVLTAAFAWRCGWLATGSAAAALLLALFALLSPMIALRGLGHFALSAQWIIWWAVAEYLEPGPRIEWWRRGLYLVVAALVHAYLLFIVLAVFAAEWLRRVWLLRQYAVFPALLRAAAIGGALLAVMALAGYFVSADPQGGDRQFGLYGADLDAWWASLDGARFATHFPATLSRNLEGMHYLGAGILALLAMGLMGAVREPAATLVIMRSHALLILAAVALALLAFTHRLGFGGRIVAEFALSDPWIARLSLFRGSGRMLWLADILLTLIAVVAMFRAMPVRAASLVVGALWLLQVADLAPPMGALRNMLAADTTVVRPNDTQLLVSPFWNEARPRYRRIAVAPMLHAAPGWISLGLLAADHGWSINTGQFARAPWPTWSSEHYWLAASLATGLLDPHTLYVLNDPTMLNLDELESDTGIGVVDGLLVVAPGWIGSGGCCLVDPNHADTLGVVFSRVGRVTPVAARIADATVHRAVGLWDDGWAASLSAIGFDAGAATALRIELQVPEAITGTQQLRIQVDGREQSVVAGRDGRIVLDLALNGAGRHLLRIEASETWTPRDDDSGDDARALAWRLLSASALD